MGLAVGAFLASLGGMNFHNGYEEDPSMFYKVATATFFLSFLMTLRGLKHLAKVRRVRMGDRPGRWDSKSGLLGKIWKKSSENDSKC